MSNVIQKGVEMPVDKDGYFRRSCPYCNTEFKIKKEDWETIQSENEYWCPYCGETAGHDAWWTQEQLDLARNVAKNIAVDIINKDFIKSLQNMHNPSAGIHVTTRELEHGNELINPDINDMTVISLPCCNKSLKIVDDWDKPVFCFYCGFPHNEIIAPKSSGD